MSAACRQCRSRPIAGHGRIAGYCSAMCEFIATGEVTYEYDFEATDYIDAHGRVERYRRDLRDKMRAIGLAPDGLRSVG